MKARLKIRFALLVVALIFFPLAFAIMDNDLGAGLVRTVDNAVYRMDSGFGHYSVGLDTVLDSRILYQAVNTTSPILVSVATVYANITPDFYTIARYNNTQIKHKGCVFVTAHRNITVNGLDMNQHQTRVYTSPSVIAIKYENSVYIVHTKKVSNDNELLDDLDIEYNTTSLDAFGIFRYAVAGIPAFGAALVIAFVAVAFSKQSQVLEGLRSEI